VLLHPDYCFNIHQAIGSESRRSGVVTQLSHSAVKDRVC
jgi:hypothetical protein